jgi:hypothetical protein
MSSLTDFDKEVAGVVGSIIGSESERAQSRSERGCAASSYHTPSEPVDEEETHAVCSFGANPGWF